MPRLPIPHGLRELPLSVTIPAAAAALAYLDAKHLVRYDLWLFKLMFEFAVFQSRLERQDRINAWYRLEELATSPKTASHLFLVIPHDNARPGTQTEWTYAEAHELVLKYARWLKEGLGVKKREIIAMDIMNKPEFIWVWFALWSLGAIPAFINANIRDSAFVHCVKISTSRLLILDYELNDVLDDNAKAQFAPDAEGRAVDTEILDPYTMSRIEGFSPYRAPDTDRSGAKPTDTALLIYTSGTTGMPKAANVNWSKPCTGRRAFPAMLGLNESDRFFTAMPLYHSSASVAGVCQVLGTGCTLVLASGFSPRTQMKYVTETKATVMQYVGEMCRYLVTSPPTPYDQAHRLRAVFGNGIRTDIWQKFKDRFNIPTIVEFYAATESPSASFVSSNNDFLRGAIGRSGTLARTLLGRMSVLLKFDHETDLPYRNPKTGLCERVPVNDVGELVYWLDSSKIGERFQGYFGNEKASSSKVVRDVLKKGDAYFRTGDLQRRDSDGRIWFIDRIGDTYRWKGENVSTAEVSEALGSHAALLEANVYGVQLPNHDGRAGCAAIGLTEGQSLDSTLGTELAAHIKQKLPRYAVPLFLRHSKELQVTGTMKHQKVALRNEGVNPAKVGNDQLFWLPPGSDRYVRFGKKDWDGICAGKAKL